MNEARDRILSRVRTALKEPARQPEPHGEPKPWFHEQPRDPESLIARFKQEFELLKGEFLRGTDAEAARGQLRGFIGQNAIKKIAASDDPILRQLLDGRDVRWIDSKTEAGTSLASFDLGITRADALASTHGSIFLTSRSGTGRALSILPPIHLVVARTEELVVDLAAGLEVWQRRCGGHWPSNAFIVTGPSRTADIEKVLVLGAHGPKRLVVLIVP